MKKLASFILCMLLMVSLVGCGSDISTTKYATEEGKQITKDNFRSKTDEYELVTEISEGYKDKEVVLEGKVDSLDIEEDTISFYLDTEANNTAFPLEINIPSEFVDVEFAEGDAIKIYGRFNGLKTEKYEDKSVDYWNVTGHFVDKK